MNSILQTYICLVLILLTLSAFLRSQANISGNITEQDTSLPTIGANISEKSTSTGTISDVNGDFFIAARDSFQLTLLISYVGYAPEEITLAGSEDFIQVQLSPQSFLVEEVVIKGQTISEKQKAAPLTVEAIRLSTIQEIPSENFYDWLGMLKGVDLTAASLGFKVINTRGFNSTSPVPSPQLIDGVDNQSPGLNFSQGNFLGSPELDVLQVSLLQGASSAF